MTLNWTDLARRDLDEIYAFIAQDNPGAALAWIRGLQARAQSATQFPRSGRVVPELDRADVREVFARSYRIVYRVLDEEIHILTVFEGHRAFPPIPMPQDGGGGS